MKALSPKLLSTKLFKLFFAFIAINLAINMSIFGEQPDNKNNIDTEVSVDPDSKPSLLNKAKKVGQGLALTAKEEGSKFASYVASYFAKKTYEGKIERPIFEKVSKEIGEMGNKIFNLYQDNNVTINEISGTLVTTGGALLPGKYQVAGAALLATLYIAYKWYSKQDDQSSDKTITIDIRPKNFDGFILLVALADNRMQVFRDHGYQLERIKADLADKNISGLNLIPELYPELINVLTKEQRQYLNDLIKEVTGSDQGILVKVKMD